MHNTEHVQLRALLAALEPHFAEEEALIPTTRAAFNRDDIQACTNHHAQCISCDMAEELCRVALLGKCR